MTTFVFIQGIGNAASYGRISIFETEKAILFNLFQQINSFTNSREIVSVELVIQTPCYSNRYREIGYKNDLNIVTFTL